MAEWEMDSNGFGFMPRADQQVTAGQRAFIHASLPEAGDLQQGDSWTPIIGKTRGIFVVCHDDQTDTLDISHLYRIYFDGISPS